MIKKINLLLSEFIKESKNISKSHPAIVVILMHEYFRSIYPFDPFIRKRYAKKDVDNIYLCLKNNISIIKNFKKVGSYFSENKSLENYLGTYEKEKKFKTQELFSKLWEERAKKNLLNSKKILQDSFKRNAFDLKFFKNKKILDMGCGSGRFSIALATLGARQVIGIDLGKNGLKIGRKNAKINKIENVKFVEGSVLALPFKDNEFDFIFCKGVLHHTGDLKKGISEFFRVMKKNGKGFLYLYGADGIFWNSRKKMRSVMKDIPLEYTIKILDLIAMPAKRTIFTDSWYVPIEEHVTNNRLIRIFNETGINQYSRWEKGRRIELETMVFSNDNKISNKIWGNGELRYIIEK